MKGQLRAAAMVCAGLVLGACGGAGEDQVITSPSQATQSTLPGTATSVPGGTSVPGAPAAPAPAAPAPAGVLPAVTVDDVGAGTKVDLASLSPSSRPLLVWLWAPH